MRRTRCGCLTGRLAGEHTAEALPDQRDRVAARHRPDPLEHLGTRAPDVGRDAAETERAGIVTEASQEAKERDQRHVGGGEPGEEHDRPARATGHSPQAGRVQRQAEQPASSTRLTGQGLGERGARCGWSWAGWDRGRPATYGRSMRTALDRRIGVRRHGGRTRDPADVVVEDGRIVDVGPGLDGDERGRLHRPDDPARASSTATSTSCRRQPRPDAAVRHAVLAELLRGRREHARARWPSASPRSARPAAPTSGVKEAQARRARRRAADADLDHDAQPDRRARRRLAGRAARTSPASALAHPGQAAQRRRRPRRDAAQGPRADPCRRRRDQGRDQRRRAVAARRPAPRPLPRRRAGGAGGGGDGGRQVG